MYTKYILVNLQLMFVFYSSSQVYMARLHTEFVSHPERARLTLCALSFITEPQMQLPSKPAMTGATKRINTYQGLLLKSSSRHSPNCCAMPLAYFRAASMASLIFFSLASEST